MGGSFTPEQVAGMFRNEWQVWTGICIVTTNYDLGIETVLSKITNFPGYYYPEHPYFDDQFQEQERLIPIIKLHGSINWLEDRTPEKKCGPLNHYDPLKIYINLLDDVELEKYRGCKHSHLLLKHKNNRYYSPIMIPFFYQKEDWFHQRWAPFFKTIIDHAKQYMKNAATFYFIGYSLPPADHYTFSLLYNIMHSNINKSITCEIIDPAEDTTLKKLFNVLISGKEKLDIYLKSENMGFISYLQQRFD